MARFANDTAPPASDVSYDNSTSGLAATNAKAALDELATEKSGIARIPREITGTTDTLVLTDNGKWVYTSNGSATTITVPPNSSVAFPVGTQIDFTQEGAGQVTFAQGSGVTINSKGSNLKLSGQYSAATLIKKATNTWTLFGDLSA